MKEKDPVPNASNFKVKISNESLKALNVYLRLRIKRDREIKERFLSENKNIKSLTEI